MAERVEISLTEETAKSTGVAEAMAYVGAIPGVPVGSAAGVQWATRGTDREVGRYGGLARSLVAAGIGMIVWKQVAGDIAPANYDARWRRGVAAGFATESLLTAILAYAL